MSMKETTKLLSITIISKPLSTRRVMKQHSAQSGPPVSHNIPLFTAQVTAYR